MNTILRTVAMRGAQQAARKHMGEGNALDVRAGWALLRDRNVPVKPKLMALGFGVALTAGLVALEMPLETILAFVAPFLGLAADFLIDGAEMLLCPVLFAALLMPHLTPKPVLQAARAKRVSPPVSRN